MIISSYLFLLFSALDTLSPPPPLFKVNQNSQRGNKRNITVFSEQACSMPLGKNGRCINIKNYDQLLKILTRPKSLPQELFDYLRDSQCGFGGIVLKVCCPEQTAILPVDTTEATTPPTTEVEGNPPDVSNHPNLRLLPHDLCGPVTQGNIIDGNNASIHDFPWIALLVYDTNSPTPAFQCGGSLINERYILTAAHCIIFLPPGLRLAGVRVRENDVNTERDCDKDNNGLEVACAEKYQDFGIESVHFHPEYSKTKLINDIALLRLDRNIDFKQTNVKPICLPTGPPDQIPEKVVVTGWNATKLGERSKNLLKVTLTPMTNAYCMEVYKKNIQIWYKQLCVGGKKRMDSCLGDSGGPLQAYGSYGSGRDNFRYIQYGILSSELTSCGIKGFPGVYTNIKYYMDWILNTMTD